MRLLAVIRTAVVLVLTAHVILYVGLRQNKRKNGDTLQV